MTKRKRTIKNEEGKGKFSTRLNRASRDFKKMQKEISPFARDRRVVENTTAGQWQQNTGPSNLLSLQDFS